MIRIARRLLEQQRSSCVFVVGYLAKVADILIGLAGNDNLSGVSSDTDIETDASPNSNTGSSSHGQTSDVKN